MTGGDLRREREAFEAYLLEKLPTVDLTRTPHGLYVRDIVQLRWETWLARARLPAAE